MTNLHAIEVKYLGPTNTLGSRVKLTSLRFKDSVIIDYDYSKNSIVEMAINWIANNASHTIFVGSAEMPSGFILLIDNFTPLRELRG